MDSRPNREWDGPFHLAEPTAKVYDSLPSFIDREWLDGEHPMQYGKLGELYNRCPRCEEWSPCRVRIMFDRLAALPSEPPSVPERLDVAWAAAEAAFGGHEADWRVLFWPGIEGYYAEVTLHTRDEGGDRETSVEFSFADSPAAALRALAAALSEPTEPAAKGSDT